ncbi:MAG: hypothetical protein GY804_10745 [Alphaproteobacteria bacterium]|nr:hypothetical protein [Alphaproteobacteria bacterium]
MRSNEELITLYKKCNQENCEAEQGRSMIEMLGVLAVVGVLSVGGITGYTTAMERYKVNKSIDQLQKIILEIKDIKESQGSYDALSIEALKQAGVLTPDMMDSAGNALNEFGGQISFADGDPETIMVIYSELPKGVCSRLASENWGSFASGLDKIFILNGTTSELKSYSWSTSTSLPIPLSNALDDCDSISGNIVAWQFK